MRLRIIFAKTEAMRFTGHLDLHRTWERTLRRATLGVSHSQGFNPRPHITLASALPLGFTGAAEVIDVWLDEPLPLADIRAKLEAACPPGIRIEQISEVTGQEPNLQASLQASHYRIDLLAAPPDLPQRVADLLTASTLPRERRGKPYDLRPLIFRLELVAFQPEAAARLELDLSANQNATGRPEAVLDALGLDPLAADIHRLGLRFTPSVE